MKRLYATSKNDAAEVSSRIGYEAVHLILLASVSKFSIRGSVPDIIIGILNCIMGLRCNAYFFYTTCA